LPAKAVEAIHGSVGGAVEAAKKLPSPLNHLLDRAAKDAFVAGLHRGVLVAAGAALLGSLVAWRWLPARGVEPDGAPPGVATTADETAADEEPTLAEVR
jgi:DHA2 family multidrug resistance protein-like MFS transporter